jgi:hypothetical protein
LRWNPNLAAGKNAVINGAFDIWQRGTSFTNPGTNTYTADRFRVVYNGTGATRTVSRQTHTPGAAPVAGQERQYFYRYAQTVAGTGSTFNQINSLIEDVRTFANQTVTLSFWARVASGTMTLDTLFFNNYGTGGSADTATGVVGSFTVTTSWQRFSVTTTLPSLSGKTIGDGSWMAPYFVLPLNSVFTLDLDGVQLEAGSVATGFETTTGTIQGELAACQRYYYRTATGTVYQLYAFGTGRSTTSIFGTLYPPVTMRTAPSSVDFANLALTDGSNTPPAVTSVALDGSLNSSPNCAQINFNVASGLTQFRFYTVTNNNSTSGYLGVNAEL